jgi:hypothetical protein
MPRVWQEFVLGWVKEIGGEKGKEFLVCRFRYYNGI